MAQCGSEKIMEEYVVVMGLLKVEKPLILVYIGSFLITMPALVTQNGNRLFKQAAMEEYDRSVASQHQLWRGSHVKSTTSDLMPALGSYSHVSQVQHSHLGTIQSSSYLNATSSKCSLRCSRLETRYATLPMSKAKAQTVPSQ